MSHDGTYIYVGNFENMTSNSMNTFCRFFSPSSSRSVLLSLFVKIFTNRYGLLKLLSLTFPFIETKVIFPRPV